MEDGFVVRRLELKDALAFVGLGKFLQSNSDFASCGFDEEKVLHLFFRIIEDENYFGAVLEKDEEVVGAILGFIQEYFFSHEKIASDLACGILPAHRYMAGAALPRMIALFEEWSKSMGAMEVCLSTSTKAHGNKYEKMLHGFGYETVGFNAKKRFF